MKTHNRFIIFLVLFMFLNPAHAMKINSYTLISDIADGQTTYQKMIIEILNDGTGELNSGSIMAAQDSKVVSISDSYGSLEYAIKTDKISNISFKFSKPLKTGDVRLIIIELKSESLVKNKDDYSEYTLVFTPKQNVSYFEHLLKLPVSAKLYSPEGFLVVFPEAEIGKINEQTTLKWKTNLTAGNPEVFLVRFKQNTTDWTRIAIIGCAIAIIALVLRALNVRLNKYAEKRKTASLLNSLNLLNENEKAVISKVIENPGIKQNELREILNCRKSSMSKIIGKLEMRRIIERKKYGKINRLYPGEKLNSTKSHE